MICGIFLLVLLLLAPFLKEWRRLPMDARARADAPGRFAPLSRGATHYQLLGPSGGPLAICVHGLSTPSFVFEALAAFLIGRGYRVLLYDHYGRGYSDRPRGRQDAWFFASHLTELLDHLDLNERFDLYGYSMGGSIAAAYAAQNPSSVKQLILLAPAGMGHKLGNLFGWASRFWGLGDWLVHARYPRLHLAGTEAERAISSSVSFLIERQQKELQYRGFIPAILSSTRGILAQKMAAEHSAIQRHGIRVLAIWGGQDHVIPVALKECLQGWNPQARQFVILDAGHALPYSHTEQVTALLEAELQLIPRVSP